MPSLHHAPGRGKEHPLKFLSGYRGRVLQCDAYQCYNALTEISCDNGTWHMVYCWTHIRRRFVKRRLDDGTLEIDTRPVENKIRPIALTRKNALFAGNEIEAENWAMVASLAATSKLSAVNPVDDIDATLCAIRSGHPHEHLMPWRYKQTATHAA